MNTFWPWMFIITILTDSLEERCEIHFAIKTNTIQSDSLKKEMKLRQTSYIVNLYKRWLTYADCFLMVANFPRFQYNQNRTLCAPFHDYYKIWTRQDFAHHSLDDHNITISSLSPLFTPYSLHTGRLSPLIPATTLDPLPHLTSETLASELELYVGIVHFNHRICASFNW